MIQHLQRFIGVLLLTAVLALGFSAPSHAVDITPGVKSGTFEVPADNEIGVPLVNKTGQEIYNVSLQASGIWKAGPSTPDGVGPEGFPNWNPERLKYFTFPELTAFSLTAYKNEDLNDHRQIGVSSGLSIPDGQGFSFLINDEKGQYDDNSLSVVVKWSVP